MLTGTLEDKFVAGTDWTGKCQILYMRLTNNDTQERVFRVEWRRAGRQLHINLDAGVTVIITNPDSPGGDPLGGQLLGVMELGNVIRPSITIPVAWRDKAVRVDTKILTAWDIDTRVKPDQAVVPVAFNVVVAAGVKISVAWNLDI